MHAADERLRTARLRVTKPRVAVLEVLDEARREHRHLLVSEVVEGARSRLGQLSIQAGYDCLLALSSAGLVRRLEVAGAPARYEISVGDNHHHLVCRRCGHTADVACTVGLAPCLAPADDQGFTIDEAEVIFWGVCPTCAAAPTCGAASAVPAS